MSKPGKTIEDRDNPRVCVPPPIVILGTLLMGLYLDGRLTVRPEFMPITVGFGVLAIISGLGLIAAALGVFRRFRTRVEPWQPASALVSSGIYRLSRNPMYLGMFLIYAGVAIALQSLMAALLLLPLFAVIDRFVVRREEAYLQRRSGEPYLEYTLEVSRWL
jgi:protein-S-isoprenylcysteine O-methyltransferase Ste14